MQRMDTTTSARVTLNARITPELQRKLRLVAHNRGVTVQAVIETQISSLLATIDAAAIRTGMSVPPGLARNPKGAQTVQLNVRISPTLAARVDALAAAVEGVTKQGLVIEALETLETPELSEEQLWASIVGETKQDKKKASQKESKLELPTLQVKVPAKKVPAKKVPAKKVPAPAKPASARPLVAIGLI